MRKILITGASGYIGSRLVDWLLNYTDFSIRILTRKNNPFFGKVESILTDYSDDALLIKACSGMDTIVHLASLNEIESANNPSEALNVNTLLTLRLLKAAFESGVKKILYFSTAHVYGSPLSGIIDEFTLPRPVHPYAITHKAAEDFINEENDKNKISGIIFRLSNGFGYPFYPEVNRWTLVVNDLCRQAIVKKKLVLQSSGVQKRDFITLTDVCRAVNHFISLDDPMGKENIFNLGGENSLSIYEMAEIISLKCNDLFSYKPPIERPEPKNNESAQNLVYKIERLKNTGFQLSGNMIEEIGELLMRCKKWFGELHE